jgi:hypothetical protein
MDTETRAAHLPALPGYWWFSYYGTLSGGRGLVR